YVHPKKINTLIPAPLDAICCKAMATKIEDRYASPKALADDIEHWLADEPVTARRDPLTARAARWTRKHRTLVTSARVVLVLGFVGSIAFATALGEKNRDLAKQTARAEEREKLAIEAVKRFKDVVSDEPVLKSDPALEDFRKKLLKEPLAFFKRLQETL